MPDAIAMLRADHKEVEALFKKFEKAGDGATKTKRQLVNQIIEMLAVHASIEEQVFYPAIREELEDLDDTVLEALEEHHGMKTFLAELLDLSADHERFDAKTTVLIEMTRHHVKEEHEEMFPKVRDALSRTRLQELGELMEEARKVAPVRPHPHAPDEPPANILVGAPTGMVDKMRNAVRSR